MHKENIRHILAISTTGLGNLVLYTPVLRALRREFPKSTLTLLVANRTAAKLVAEQVDKVIVLEKRSFKPLALWNFWRKARKQKFDLVVTSFLDKSFKVSLFSRLTGAPYRVGYKHPFYGWLYTHQVEINEQKHEIEYNLDLLRAIGLTIRRSSEKAPFIHITALEEELANDFLLKNEIFPNDLIIGVHPGSGLAAGPAKRWSREKFAALCDLILNLPRTKVIIFGGPEEKTDAEKIAEFMRKNPVVAAGLDIRTTASLIKKCRLFISNDSGLMHVATAFKTPVLAIFGPTLWWKNYPWGKNNFVIRKTLFCSPCYDYKKIECVSLKCLIDISVNEVWAKVQQMLGRST